MKHLLLDLSKCTGCRICEFSCSMYHYSVFNPNRARIRINRIGCLKLEAKYCIQCQNPRCISACPEGAIIQNESGIRIDPEICTNCHNCMSACERIFLDVIDKNAIICDQCGACIETCPEGALEMRE